ncbi:MAG TPA: carboxylesterase/lipase family protein [Sphingomicrobium sp.]|nr:carboxylesterase/lipase family protein [Sphingomicrobium sp.]
MLDRRSLLAAGTASILATPSFAATRDPVVTTRLGPVRGLRENGVNAFRGIRYGTASRFLAPVAPSPSRELVAATEFGPSAPQSGAQYKAQSEDCLFLNVWTPEARRGPKLPVMVYFHGGAYSGGSVVDPLNHGQHLANHGVVAVTVNHRLNALGYFYLARLDPRYPDSGNLGQLDLILALKWIRDNIAAFGGDPERVMVFGQSGGGAKIATLMGMAAASGLFHSAATMSGQQVTVSGPLHATERARAYLDRLKATPAEAATLPVQRLIDALDAKDPIMGGGVYFGPVLDMKWLTRHPFWPDSNPIGNAIPMVLGNTHDETRAFIGPDKLKGLNWDNLADRIAPELKVDILPEWVVEQYRRLFPTYTPTDIFYAATTAGRSWRGQIEEAEARAKANTPTWVYQLNFRSPVEPWKGAPHMLDIPLVFGTLDAPDSIAGTGTRSQAMSGVMMRAFISLAASGNPNGSGLPSWPMYRLPRRSTMIFDFPSHIEDDPRRAQREIFARVPYIQPGT